MAREDTSFSSGTLNIRDVGFGAMWDEGQTVCEGPPDLRGLRLAELGLHLRTQCHPSLGHQDYLFFIAIGFVIFAAGTVLAWLTGVVMVLFERYVKREDGELDSEREEVKEEAGG
ncbi:leucine-rich repeat-containing protein 52-like isoform X2 [Alosa sapidissima]|uniref:leucine-rich repeat-containing protein 52-like isoform X2 n=1 Tax=Alosa sapidissima TaxID=34773 RepID=UPI001C095402|nr:leucine-rich repeat-containing protein 52-like isoform X2 [Alosa sapidissima]